MCAIGATKKGVSLRFLYGFILDDPLGILRAGSSVLMNWDVAFDGEVDAAAIGTYVTEAVAKYPDYKADADRIQTAARAAHARPPRPR